jgi:hypothetical protein|tara:strand:+ start:127 stop:459 length:333 start_codon:yes stop_codon:yes gene_type:complete
MSSFNGYGSASATASVYAEKALWNCCKDSDSVLRSAVHREFNRLVFTTSKLTFDEKLDISNKPIWNQLDKLRRLGICDNTGGDMHSDTAGENTRKNHTSTWFHKKEYRYY